MIAIDTPLIHKSIAIVLSSINSNAYIYDNPNQQATKLPAWFITHREPVKIEREIGRAWLIYSIDLFYMLEYNTPRLFDDYATVADSLNTSLIYLPIYGLDGVKTQVYEREWGLQLDALKYSFTLRFRVKQDTVPDEKMQVIEDLSVFLKNQSESYIIFTNEDHPEFDVSFPTSLYVQTGKRINLPMVSGSFTDDNYIWTPSAWSIGAFNESVLVEENTTANLLWSSENRRAEISFVNNEYPQFYVEMPETMFVLKGTAIELPTVSGSFDDGEFEYTPVSWSIGAFGESVVVNEDTVVELVWNKQQLKYTGYPTSAGNTPKDVTVRSYTSDLYDENGNPIQTTQRIGSATAYTVNGGQVYGFQSLVVVNGLIKIFYNSNYTWITIHHIEYTLI